MPDRVDVAVIGGGITGLAAAYALARRRVSFVLFEASSRWGGLVLTDRVGGFLLEGGPDALHVLKPEGIGLVRELGLSSRLVPTNPKERAVYVLHRGRLHPMPEGMILGVPTRLRPFLASTLFSWRGKMRMALDLAVPRRKDGRDESIAAFVGRRLGREAVERLAEPLLAGIHAGAVDRLSIRATFPQLVALEAGVGGLIRGMRSGRTSAPSSSDPTVFVTLVGGLGELVDALVSRLPDGSLRKQCRVRSIVRTGSGLEVALESGEHVVAQRVLVAAPVPEAARLLRDLSPQAARGLAEIPFASTATVLLGYRRADVAHPLNGYGLLVPRTEGLRTTACTFVSTKFPGRAPEGHVLLRGFVGGALNPHVLRLDDASLAGTVQSDLRGVLGLRADPVLTRVYRWPQGTPQMEVGHFERLAAIEADLRTVPGLWIAGAGVRGTGIPDCISDAKRAVTALLSG